jgi:putative aldouronate transport system substrate-binding protein
MRDMYDQKMIDRDIANMKGTQSYDKFASGTSAALLLVGYGNVNNNVNERWKKLHPDTPMVDAIKKADYFPATDGVKYQCTFKTYWSESYFSNKVDDKKMDRIMMLYDYMLQPETKEFYRYGVKDVDYTKDGDKITKITSQADLDKKQPSSANLQAMVEFDNAYLYDPNNSTIDPAISKAAIEDLKHAREVTKQPDYEVKLTDISTPTKNKFSIQDYDFMLKIMAGKEPVEKMWDDVLKEYEKKGLSKMIEEVNAKAKEMGLN